MTGPRSRVRRGAVTRYQEALRGLAAGAKVSFDLPDRQPMRRDEYKRINGAAHALFGSGGYTLSCRTGAGVVIVARPARGA